VSSISRLKRSKFPISFSVKPWKRLCSLKTSVIGPGVSYQTNWFISRVRNTMSVCWMLERIHAIDWREQFVITLMTFPEISSFERIIRVFFSRVFLVTVRRRLSTWMMMKRRPFCNIKTDCYCLMANVFFKMLLPLTAQGDTQWCAVQLKGTLVHQMES
jgi:hypothetical protein